MSEWDRLAVLLLLFSCVKRSHQIRTASHRSIILQTQICKRVTQSLRECISCLPHVSTFSLPFFTVQQTPTVPAVSSGLRGAQSSLPPTPFLQLNDSNPLMGYINCVAASTPSSLPLFTRNFHAPRTRDGGPQLAQRFCSSAVQYTSIHTSIPHTPVAEELSQPSSTQVNSTQGSSEGFLTQ